MTLSSNMEGKPWKFDWNRWDGGITNDPRDPTSNTSRMLTNFDALTDPRRLTPFPSSTSFDSDAAASNKQAFCIANRSSSTYKLFALGVNASGRAKVMMKSIATAGSDDLADDTWETPSNNESSAGAPNFECFLPYRYSSNTYIYGFRALSHIWRFDADSSDAWDDTHQAVTYATCANGLVHSQDDIAYLPYDNKIASNDAGSWTLTALTIPAKYYITSICEYGRFLAIAAAPLDGVSGSRVYIWDRDSSLETMYENLDWGDGVLKVLDVIDGVLVGISLVSTGDRIKRRIEFKAYNGNGVQLIESIESTASIQLPIFKQVIRNRLHFMMQATINGAAREGVWSFGRNSAGQWCLAQERTVNNDTALSTGVLKGFFYAGDYLIQSFTNSSGTYFLNITDAPGDTYTATSIAESGKKTMDDSNWIKKLDRVTLTYDPLPSGATVTVKYRKNEETSFTTAFTSSTADEISYSATNHISTGVTLPEFKEMEFRIESTGGAVITGFSAEGVYVKRTP